MKIVVFVASLSNDFALDKFEKAFGRIIKK